MGTAAATKQVKNNGADALINLRPLLDLLRAVIWTGVLDGDEPVSVVLVAPQESAKTELLKLFRGTSGLEYFSDLTSNGLLSFRNEIENKKLRHIVLLDLIRIMAHPRVTTERTLQTIASLIEDGQMTVADAGGISWRADKNIQLPRIGAMMAVTPQMYARKRKMFRDTGFMSRFLPVKYTYSEETAHLVHKSIRTGSLKPLPVPVTLPPKQLKATIPDRLAKLIEQSASDLGTRQDTWGFRWHRSLRALAKANAISHQRFTVTESDIVQIQEWMHFFNEPQVL